MTDNNDFLTTKQVALMLLVDERTVQRMADEGILPYTNVGLRSRRRYRFKLGDVEDYLKKRESRQPTEQQADRQDTRNGDLGCRQSL